MTDADRVRDHLAAVADVPAASAARRAELAARLVSLRGGFFDMGARKSTYEGDLDSPRLRVKLRPFLISATSVTNLDFADFVDDTGYRTVAEREGWSFVFHLFLKDPDNWIESPPDLPWWRKVDGAYWARPEGPDSTYEGRETHPTVHIAWYDALAYCAWAGLRLPSEAEWEYAARGGLAKQKYPWGNALTPGGAFAMNTWQGDFPHINIAEDGHAGTAPVDAFHPNGYGLFNMTGNVWEWVEDAFGPRDGYQPSADDDRGKDWRAVPRVQRGGSFLCHESHCDRYHVHSRTRNDPDSSTGNCGFRVASTPEVAG
ncbi:formylglycine-generating enzyme family protein [Oceanibium sediminis]|uniref:formylglycine-generating enzyme family protein n=1 Tax=Oceanibium sediminis TaxID=2026339 RepID=UPI000DD4BF00|nr:formylglycine-generating enzyme family protein [Oceanibium sediminis]